MRACIATGCCSERGASCAHPAAARCGFGVAAVVAVLTACRGAPEAPDVAAMARRVAALERRVAVLEDACATPRPPARGPAGAQPPVAAEPARPAPPPDASAPPAPTAEPEAAPASAAAQAPPAPPPCAHHLVLAVDGDAAGAVASIVRQRLEALGAPDPVVEPDADAGRIVVTARVPPSRAGLVATWVATRDPVAVTALARGGPDAAALRAHLRRYGVLYPERAARLAVATDAQGAYLLGPDPGVLRRFVDQALGLMPGRAVAVEPLVLVQAGGVQRAQWRTRLLAHPPLVTGADVRPGGVAVGQDEGGVTLRLTVDDDALGRLQQATVSPPVTLAFVVAGRVEAVVPVVAPVRRPVLELPIRGRRPAVQLARARRIARLLDAGVHPAAVRVADHDVSCPP